MDPDVAAALLIAQIVQGALPAERAGEPLCGQTDPEAFFPSRGDQRGAARARLVCMQCKVRADCLDGALERHERHGIWGATTGAQRRELNGESSDGQGAAPDPDCGVKQA
jgi:WhiB family redox-sensing transcriptional regulator